MAEIVPTILTSDLDDFNEKLTLAREMVGRVQIDIVDGKFANRKTVDLSEMVDLKEMTDLKKDLHLMVNEPENWITRSFEVLPDLLIGQVETMSDPLKFINEVVESGMLAGIALDLETPIEKVSEEVYRMADLILVLAVKAGVGGQEFDIRAIEKIKKIREMLEGPLSGGGKIGVDGGLNDENILLCKKAGADIFYVGQSFWQAEDLNSRYNQLIKLVS